MSSTVSVSFESTTDSLRTLMALLSRHAYLPVENLHYNRNFVQILAEGVSLMRTLGDKAHCPILGPCDRMQADYTETTHAQIDKNKLQELRRELLASVAVFADTGLAPNNIEQDLRDIKKNVMRQTADDIPRQIDRAFSQLCRLSPFVYGHDGIALPNINMEKITSQIQNVEPAEIDNLYNDYLPKHLAPLFIRASNNSGFGNLHKVTRNTVNQFIPRIVHPAIQLYSSNKQHMAVRTITLETIPPVYSPLRGALAGDCSMVSVPYYGLHRNSHSFWIRKHSSFDSKPAGYVILTLVNTTEGTLPYVITINGITLTTADTLAVFHLLANHFDTETILITDVSINSSYVNTASIKQAYLKLAGSPAIVTLPSGWDTISDFTRSYIHDYYRQRDACHVRQVMLNSLEPRYKITRHAAASPYQVPEDYAKSPILSRAITAYYYESSGLDNADAQAAQQLLCVSKDDMEAIQSLVNMYYHHDLSLDGFLRMHRQFGFGLIEVAKLEIDIKAPLLRSIYDKCHDLFPKHEWVDAITSLNRELSGMIAQDNEFIRHDLDSIKDMKISLPDIYITNYWDEVRPLLFLPNGYASLYHCQRYVKSFQSVGTIDAFLDFLLEFPHLLETLDTEYNRWSAFFIRARRLLGDTDKLQRAIQLAYVDHVLDTGKSHTCYHLAKTLVEYECILGHADPLLKQEIIARQFTQQIELEEFNKYHEEYSTRVNAA